MHNSKQIDEIWEPKISDWEEIGIESYKFIFDQASIRLSEVLSQSNAMTERGFKMLYANITFLAALIGISVRHLPNMWILTIVGSVYVANFITIYLLLHVKSEVFNGSPPEEIFIDSLDRNDYTKEDRLSLLYYNEICRYQKGIEINSKVNLSRQKRYLASLILSICLFIVTIGIAINSL